MSCEKHKKEVAGITDPKVLARMFADTHYEFQSEVWKEYHFCLHEDGIRDLNHHAQPKPQLANKLNSAAINAFNVYSDLLEAWEISKPFMEEKNNLYNAGSSI